MRRSESRTFGMLFEVWFVHTLTELSRYEWGGLRVSVSSTNMISFRPNGEYGTRIDHLETAAFVVVVHNEPLPIVSVCFVVRNRNGSNHAAAAPLTLSDIFRGYPDARDDSRGPSRVSLPTECHFKGS